MEITWVEGDTSQRIFVLNQGDVAVDLTGASVEVLLRPVRRTPLPEPLRVYEAVIISAAEGKVGWSPAATQLKVSESPYTARLRVTLSGVMYYFPFPSPDTWLVIE